MMLTTRRRSIIVATTIRKKRNMNIRAMIRSVAMNYSPAAFRMNGIDFVL